MKKINLIFNKTLTEEELLKLVNENTIGIISGTELITKKVLKKAKNLQVISNVELELIILISWVNKKIKIYKTSKEPSIAVAEFVICQIFDYFKKSFKS